VRGDTLIGNRNGRACELRNHGSTLLGLPEPHNRGLDGGNNGLEPSLQLAADEDRRWGPRSGGVAVDSGSEGSAFLLGDEGEGATVNGADWLADDAVGVDGDGLAEADGLDGGRGGDEAARSEALGAGDGIDFLPGEGVVDEEVGVAVPDDVGLAIDDLANVEAVALGLQELDLGGVNVDVQGVGGGSHCG